MPIFELSAQSTPGFELWMRACAAEQEVSPAAAEGFSVIPSGSVTVTLLTWELSISDSRSCLTETSLVKPSGWSCTSVAGVTEKPGSKGTTPQLLRWRGGV